VELGCILLHLAIADAAELTEAFGVKLHRNCVPVYRFRDRSRSKNRDKSKECLSLPMTVSHWEFHQVCFNISRLQSEGCTV